MPEIPRETKAPKNTLLVMLVVYSRTLRITVVTDAVRVIRLVGGIPPVVLIPITLVATLRHRVHRTAGHLNRRRSRCRKPLISVITPGTCTSIRSSR